jgi:hypothetical protein
MDNQIQWLTEHGFRVMVNSSVPPGIILIITPLHPHFSLSVPESYSLVEYLALASGPFEIRGDHLISIVRTAIIPGGQD